jgi:hypothetical protein
MFSICIKLMLNLMYVIRCRLYFVLGYVFFYKLNIECIFYPVVTGELTSASMLLL